MRRLAGRLAEEQALLGSGRVEPPAVELAGDPAVVLFRGEAAKRQAEPVLPRPLAVARALVAPHPGQERHDLVENDGANDGAGIGEPGASATGVPATAHATANHSIGWLNEGKRAGGAIGGDHLNPTIL